MTQRKNLPPHDRYFKQLLGDKKRAQDFIRGAFPPALLQKLQLQTLQPEPDSYLDEELRAHFADLVYSCHYDHTSIKVTLLFEHKSYVPAYPVELQLLEYMLRIWKKTFPQAKRLIPVIPLVFYHGQEDWQVRQLRDYGPRQGYPAELLAFLPEFQYLLVQLSQYEEVQVRELFESLDLQMGLLLMQRIFDEELVSQLSTIFAGMESLLDNLEGRDFFDSSLLYLYYSKKGIGMDRIAEELSKSSERGRKRTLTIAEELIEEGMEKGIKKGMKLKEREMEIKEREMVLKMLRSGQLSISQIADFTGLDVSYINALQRKL